MPEVKKTNGVILNAYLDIRSGLAASVARMLICPEDVEDVLQESYMLVYAQSKKTEIKSIKGYFFRVARNIALKDVARRTKAKYRSLEEIAPLEIKAESVGADLELHYSMKLQAFVEVTKTLPEKCRQAFLLKKLMGLSQKEIAQKMGIAESTVEKHLITAMRRTVVEMKTRGYLDGSIAKLDELNKVAVVKSRKQNIAQK